MVISKHNDSETFYTIDNIKCIYVERHFREKIEQLHQSVLIQRCESRTSELRQKYCSRNTHLINTSPDIFTLNLIKRTKFIAHRAGEVGHVVQCFFSRSAGSRGML